MIKGIKSLRWKTKLFGVRATIYNMLWNWVHSEDKIVMSLPKDATEVGKVMFVRNARSIIRRLNKELPPEAKKYANEEPIEWGGV